jgi:uncharacterized protein YegL
MRLAHSLTLASAPVVGLLLVGGLRLLPARAAAPAQLAESPCTVVADRDAAPAVVPLGQWSKLTMRVRATCPITALQPLHLVLVLDASGSMAGEKNGQMKKAVKQLIRDLKLDEHPQMQMGVVKFSGTATTMCQLTNDAGRLTGCVNKVDANGGSAIDLGIREGLAVLKKGRPRGDSGGAVREIMLVVSDGPDGITCEAAVSAAAAAKSQLVAIMTVTLTGGDGACMRRIASSSAVARETDVGGLVQALIDLNTRFIAGIALRRLEVDEVLAADMRLVPDSAAPPPASVSITGRAVHWRLDYPAAATTITYWVQPQALGRRPLSVSAGGTLIDSAGQLRPFRFPNLVLDVVDQPALPTPTPLPTSSTPPPFVTEVLPSPTPTPDLPRPCAGLGGRVPPAAIAAAMANPQQVAGWGLRCNPNVAPGPGNPLRRSLGLKTPSQPYHPLFNGLELKCGCP